MEVLQPNYKTIFTISAPLMLGSATQQIIVLSDNVFLYHQSLQDFGAIALVGVFYLLITAIGFGFSRGGQILIARRHGEGNAEEVKSNFYTLLAFQVGLAFLLFFLIYFFADEFFAIFINSDAYYERILSYIYPRSYGIFFSYIGFTFIAFYSGIAITRIIVIDTIILAVVNVVLNYALILGKFGFEPMGIRGAAIASTMAEIIAFLFFVGYMLFDKSIREFRLWGKVKYNKAIGKKMFSLSSPIVMQSFLGLGSYFIFFSIIEQNMGEKPLEISNLIRNVYLILSIPCWGFAAGINTLVSNFIGQKRPKAAILVIKRTVILCLIITLAFTIPIVIDPEYFLYPLYGGSNGALISESVLSFRVLLLILLTFSLSTILMNSVMGAGATVLAFNIQFWATAFYLGLTWFLVYIKECPIHLVWTAEIFYWLIILIATYRYMITARWWNRSL